MAKRHPKEVVAAFTLSFEKDPSLPAEEKKRLAEEFGLVEHRVSAWFSKRRGYIKGHGKPPPVKPGPQKSIPFPPSSFSSVD